MRLTQEEKEGRARHLEAIKKMDDDALLIAYAFGTATYPNIDVYDPLVRAVLEGRLLTKIAEGTERLALINEQSTIEVKRLVASSLTIERLTKWLVGLTVVLGVLTLVLALDVGNKVRKEYFSPTPLVTAPQTPSLPPRKSYQ